MTTNEFNGLPMEARSPMAQDGDSLQVTKVLTYVFDDEAPLPETERLDLTDGLFLAPVPPLLLQNDDEYHLMAVEPHFSAFCRDHLHATALNVAYRGRKDLNYESVKSEEELCKRKIDHYLLAAMIFSPQFLAPYAGFVTIPEANRVCHSSRMKDFGRLESIGNASLTEADFISINQLCHPIKDVLSTGVTGRLPTALRYYQQAFRTDIDGSVRFLGLMMAMEALFSHGASEVSHQVSERTAFFLKESADEREKLYDDMRSHYSLRSAIAHGGTPEGGQKKGDAPFNQLLRTLRDALASILGNTKLLSLFVSGDSKRFKEAMRSLIFRGTATP